MITAKITAGMPDHCHPPFSPSSATRSQKQYSEACGVGYLRTKCRFSSGAWREVQNGRPSVKKGR